MIRNYVSKLSVILGFSLLIFSTNLFASAAQMHTITSCNDATTKDMYNIDVQCIDGEKIIRKNLLDSYGGNNVEYRTKLDSFTQITSYNDGSNISWKIISKDGLTYDYSIQSSKEEIKTYRLTKVTDVDLAFIDIPYTSSEITFMYEDKTRFNKNNHIKMISALNSNNELSLYSLDYDELNSQTSINAISTAPVILKELTKIYNFDVNKNILRETINGTNVESRIQKWVNEDITGGHTLKFINALGNIQINTYDANKNLISLLDVNNLETLYEYDGSNRLTKVTKPEGIITTYSYSTNDLIENATSKTVVTTTGEPQVTKYYDSSNRQIRTSTIGFNNINILKNLSYDSQGRLSQYSIPYYESEKEYFINMSYDSQNRVITLDKPGLEENRLVTSYEYLGDNTIITLPNGKQETINNNGVSNTITYTYDILDNLIKIEDSSDLTINLEYDVLNRLIKKEFVNTTQNTSSIVHIVYDRATNAIGKIAYEKSNDYKKEYYYDEFSRVNANKYYIASKIFTTQFTYNANGKLEKTISPDGFTSINEYNSAGYLSAIKSPKIDSSELGIDAIKVLIAQNLTDDLSIYNEYLDLKTRINFYTLKKAVYENISSLYTATNPLIEAQLNSVAVLLGDTIIVLNKDLLDYEKVISNYKKIRENYLLPKAVASNDEDTFKWLNTTFEEKAKEYVNLSTTYIDKASILLEEIVSNPALLNNDLYIDNDLITFYKNTSDEINTYTNALTTLSENYWTLYVALKNGDGEIQKNAYLGILENDEYKYFYKVLDMDSLRRVTHEIFGNGLVTKKEYSASNKILQRLTTGYYGNNDIKDIKFSYDKNNNLLSKYDVKEKFTQNYVYDESERLISASSIGTDFYTNFSYDYAATNTSGYVYDESTNSYLNADANTTVLLNAPQTILKNGVKNETLYSYDAKSYKTTITNNEIISNIFKVGESFKYEVYEDEIKYKNYIYANGVVVAIHDEENLGDILVPNNYYIHKDIFNSVDIITNESAVVEKQVSYKPYGEQSDISWSTTYQKDSSITALGFKGFESNNVFNLVSINGYLYDPVNVNLLVNNTAGITSLSLDDSFSSINPTKYFDKKLDNWHNNVSGLLSLQNMVFDSSSFLDYEMNKQKQSLSTYSNAIISSTTPLDTSKIWYKPNEAGGLDILVNDTNESTAWTEVGTSGSLTTVGSITTTSIEQLNIMPCFYKDLSFVDMTNGKKHAFTCSVAQQWLLGGNFVGTYTINEAGNELISSIENSTLSVQATNDEFAGSKIFTKKGSSWLDAGIQNIITTSLTNVLSVSDTSTNTKAFVVNTNDYELNQQDIPDIGNKWVYIASDVLDAMTNFDAIENDEGGYLFITSINKLFTHVTNGTLDFWTDNTTGNGEVNATFIYSKGDRENLPDITHDLTVLTKDDETIFKQWYYTMPFNTIPSNPVMFETVLYTGNGSTQTINTSSITTGVDFAWIKDRSLAQDNHIYDSIRGTDKALMTNATSSELSNTNALAFNGSGFDLGNPSNTSTNKSGSNMVAWVASLPNEIASNTAGTITSHTKSNEFMSVVSYTGSGANATVGHGLGKIPELIIYKDRDTVQDWIVYNKTIGATQALELDDSYSAFTASYFNNTEPTSTEFSLGTFPDTNLLSSKFIAYAFTSVEGVSKVGTYTGTGLSGNSVDLGFEPQWIMMKRTDGTGSWYIHDIERGTNNFVYANYSNGDSSQTLLTLNTTGFDLDTTNAEYNEAGGTYIYLAIAKQSPPAPTPAVQTSAEFETVTYTGNGTAQTINTSNITTGIDFVWAKSRNTTHSHYINDSIRGIYSLVSDVTEAEQTFTHGLTAFNSNGFDLGSAGGHNGNNNQYVAWVASLPNETLSNTAGTITSHTKVAASGFMSAIAYTGNWTTATIGHGLSKAPELIFTKNRDLGVDWGTYVSSSGATKPIGGLNSTVGEHQWGEILWNDTEPTDSVFSVGAGSVSTNGNSQAMIAYAFTSVEGVSKVGSYTGTGASGNNIDLGFEPQWIMVKRTDSTGSWYIYDSERGDNNHLYPNLSNAEESPIAVTLDTDGFTLNTAASGDTNSLGGTYIYLAIAKSKTASTDITSSTDPFNDGSLVAKYEFTNDANDTRNIHNGNSTGISVDGKFGNGTSITNNQKITLPDSLDTSINWSNPWTYSYWFKTNDNTINDASVFSNYKSKFIASGYTTSNGIQSYVNQAPDTTLIISSGIIPLIDTWYHVTHRYDGSNLNLYVNGVNVGTSLSFNGNYRSDAPDFFGFGYTSKVSTTTIDQVEIYNRALTSDEINNLYILTNLLTVPQGQSSDNTSIIIDILESNSTISNLLYYKFTESTQW